MGTMINQVPALYSPPLQRPLLKAVTALMHYPLHADALEYSGKGAPNLTVNGTVGTLWSANWAAATPDGAAHYLTSAQGNAVLGELFDLTDLNNQELLIGFDLQTDGALTQNEGILGWGSNQNGAGLGGFYVYTNAASQACIAFRGPGSSNENNYPIAATGMANTDRHSVVLSLVGTSSFECTLSVYRWRHGTGLLDTAQQTALDMRGVGGSAPVGVPPTYALTLLARRDTAAYSRFLGAAAGSNALLGNVWAARLSSPQVGLANLCLQDMYVSRGEVPKSLRA